MDPDRPRTPDRLSRLSRRARRARSRWRPMLRTLGFTAALSAVIAVTVTLIYQLLPGGDTWPEKVMGDGPLLVAALGWIAVVVPGMAYVAGRQAR